MHLRGRSGIAALLSFEAPFLLLLVLLFAAVPVTPHDPANLPFTSALVALSAGDALIWELGWLGAARLRSPGRG